MITFWVCLMEGEKFGLTFFKCSVSCTAQCACPARVIVFPFGVLREMMPAATPNRALSLTHHCVGHHAPVEVVTSTPEAISLIRQEVRVDRTAY